VCVCVGHPAVLRYWQESNVTADWLKPDQSSGLTVETTAYVLLTVLLKVHPVYPHCLLVIMLFTLSLLSLLINNIDYCCVKGADPLRQPHPVLADPGSALRKGVLLHAGTHTSLVLT